MADEKEKAQQKQRSETTGGDEDKGQSSGAGSSGGNMGAGRSGKENLGSEKPSDEAGMGSQKPGGSGSQS